MAAIKYTAIVQSIVGKIAGSVFQRSRAGYTIKSKSKNTGRLVVGDGGTARITPSGGIGTVTSKWNTLSETEKMSFTAGAELVVFKNKLGEVYQASGFQVFTSINKNRELIGESLLNSMPLPQVKENLVNAHLSQNHTLDWILNWDNAIDDNYRIIVYVSSPCRKGVSSYYGGFKCVSIINPDGIFAYNLLPDMVQALGVLTVGAKYFFEYVVIGKNDGVRGGVGRVSDAYE
jgi:hypothetical protein